MFQCSSASRKFLNLLPSAEDVLQKSRFSALQRAENSSIYTRCCDSGCCDSVSVLFSEPKIPQYPTAFCAPQPPAGFSALQRAENSSIQVRQRDNATLIRGFSALQRAENSSIRFGHIALLLRQMFQCSSASRKFLNHPQRLGALLLAARFSALQRAENSSIAGCVRPRAAHQPAVSVLFSEPKIPQWRVVRAAAGRA